MVYFSKIEFAQKSLNFSCKSEFCKSLLRSCPKILSHYTLDFRVRIIDFHVSKKGFCFHPKASFFLEEVEIL
jgi:hypothetical protein